MTAKFINLKKLNMKTTIKLKINPIQEYLGLFFLLKSCEHGISAGKCSSLYRNFIAGDLIEENVK
jgi:hypothetical protein